MAKSETGGAAREDAATARAGRDSPKRQGDKLGAATGGAGIEAAATDAEASGDSPKPHGDKLERAVGKASSR